MSEKNKYGYEHDDGHYSKMTGNDTNSSYSVYDKNPSEEDHSAIHVNINTDTGKGSIVEHDGDGNTEKTDISCYLTTACMRHHAENFNDKCDELETLRWFRDTFVSKQDKEHYYEIAPSIVAELENVNDNDKIYEYIYNNVVKVSVEAIKNKDYGFAYDKYKNSVLALKRVFLDREQINKKGFVRKLSH